MVQEVKVQSSNFAAEYGSGGMNISAVTKGGSSKFSGTVYDYYRDHRFAANDRSNSIARLDEAEEHVQLPGRQRRRPDRHPGLGASRRTATSCSSSSASKSQRQKVDPGARFGVVPTLHAAAGRLQRVRDSRRDLGQPVGTQVLIPQGFPGAGTPAPGGNLAPYIDDLGRVLVNLVSRAELRRSQSTGTTTCSASSSRRTAST